MNHIYRTIWSHAQQCVVVVPETASTSGGSQSESGPESPKRWVAKLSVLVAALVGAGVVMAQSLPTGGQIAAGSGQISQSGTQLTVNQGSDRLVTNWQSFNIGAGHSVQFNQPSASAVALNRVLGSDVSSIQGALRANGQVFLLNPNGVVFSPTAQVNVGGLVASTLKLSDADFMAGRYQLSGSSTQAVINQGKIEVAQGGNAALVAARIVNDGQIKAPGGQVLLGAGQAVTLDFGGPVQMQISQGALNAQIANGGAIVAEGGHVLLSARAAAHLGNAVVNQTGLIEASSLQAQGGSIRLSAEGGAIVQTGQLKADGQTGGSIEASGRAMVDAGQWSAQGSSGKGGSIHLQTSQSLEQTAAAQLNASGAQGGGSVRIDGGASAYLSGSSKADGRQGGAGGDVSATAHNLILAGAQLQANGVQGGGRVRVGGGWQGGDADMLNAASTTVTASSQLSANATGQGDGGTVVVWSEQGTGVAAKIEARGGAQGGDGGKVETSSKGALAFAAQVDVTAAKGRAGQVLLDPKNITISNDPGNPGFAVTSLTYQTPQAGDGHGNAGAVELSNGRIVVASSQDSTIASGAGAVRMYQADGTLISTLTGSQAGDAVGNAGITALSDGNYVVASSNWANGTAAKAGAVTWGSAATGVSGVVSSSNSLVGSQANSLVGSNETSGKTSGVVALSDGRYAVLSSNWVNGTATRAGAVTWVNNAADRSGVIGSGNSLVGTKTNDAVGLGGITALSNGNYVVTSNRWGNGTAARAGAVTWVDGNAGIRGELSSSNSLVGSQQGDYVGYQGVKALSNGNYVVVSSNWANGAAKGAGAVTWGNGLGGTNDAVSSSNSLVGSRASDSVGTRGVTALSNGNYVVGSSEWTNGTYARAGAVTWGNGNGGTVGLVSSLNSLVGSQAGDTVGLSVMALSNGNYVVLSQDWANGTASKAGAVTWGDGLGGISGAVSSSNSLVGGRKDDRVGYGGNTPIAADNFNHVGITTLANGNYIVNSAYWVNGTATNAGAVTWVDGTKGIAGLVSSSNSLVGTQANDFVGSNGITVLGNGSYVVVSSEWANGTASKAGAVTWGSATSGVRGQVSSSNSLVGSQTGDRVGYISTIDSVRYPQHRGITALSNGNYVVHSESWRNGTASNAGAVTWVDGSKGIAGVVSSGNSLVGGQSGDYVGYKGITELSNGNYVVNSDRWAHGAAKGAGAVTWVSGTQGLAGLVGSHNSLVGSQTGDAVGFTGITALNNGHYVVASRGWSNGTVSNAGAVTWGDGVSGTSGVVSSSNSLVGSHANDRVGSGGIKALRNGDYAVLSPNWANGAITRAGAITLGLGFAGMKGVIDSGNSLVGTQVNDAMGNGQFLNLANGSILVASPDYRANQGRVDILWHGQSTPLLYSLDPGANYQLNAGLLAALLATGAQVTLQANTDISLLDALNVNSAQGGDLTLQAGRSILLNADVHTGNGNLTMVANDTAASGVVDAHRDAGAGNITQAAGTTIDAGTATVSFQVRDGQGIANAQAGTISLANVRAGDLHIDSPNLVASLTANDKVYDGTTTAQAKAAVSGLVLHSGSNLRLLASAYFTDKNAGAGKAVTADALAITGFNGQKNSTLHNNAAALTPTTTADIERRVLDLAGIKTPDGTTTYQGWQIAPLNVVAGDRVQLSGFVDVSSAEPGRYAFLATNHLQPSDSNYSVVGGNANFMIVPRLPPEVQQSIDPLDVHHTHDVWLEEKKLHAQEEGLLNLAVQGAKAPEQPLQRLN